MSFAENLKKFMKNNKITAAEIAEKVGLSRGTVTHWSNGLRFPGDEETIKEVAKILRVSVDDLFADDDRKPVARIPVIGETSCGSPISSSFQDLRRTCHYRGDVFHPDLYCVIASGESMASEIEDGDEIICDPRASVQHGDLVHYTIHGESAVKLYTIDEDANIIQFVPYNPSPDFKVRTVRLDDDEAEELKIAKVVSVNKLKFNNRVARLRLIGRA